MSCSSRKWDNIKEKSGFLDNFAIKKNNTNNIKRFLQNKTQINKNVFDAW